MSCKSTAGKHRTGVSMLHVRIQLGFRTPISRCFTWSVGCWLQGVFCVTLETCHTSEL
jgi:hypothetical protein